jgi:hypothetical protein
VGIPKLPKPSTRSPGLSSSPLADSPPTTWFPRSRYPLSDWFRRQWDRHFNETYPILRSAIVARGHAWPLDSLCDSPHSLSVETDCVAPRAIVVRRVRQKSCGEAMSPQPSAPANMSGFEQTIRLTPNRVCAVPFWMLQFPRPEARQVHNALRVPRKDRNKIQSQVTLPTAARRRSIGGFYVKCISADRCTGSASHVGVWTDSRAEQQHRAGQHQGMSWWLRW